MEGLAVQGACPQVDQPNFEKSDAMGK